MIKASTLEPGDKFVLVEPYWKGVVFTVRRQWGDNMVECWSEHTMRIYVPSNSDVELRGTQHAEPAQEVAPEKGR